MSPTAHVLVIVITAGLALDIVQVPATVAVFVPLSESVQVIDTPHITAYSGPIH